MKKLIILFILISLSIPVFAIQKLYPGIIVNGDRLKSIQYLLTSEEMSSFSVMIVELNFYKKECIRKESELKIYKDYNKELLDQLSALYTEEKKYLTELKNSYTEMISEHKKHKRSRRKSFWRGVMNGVSYSLMILGVKNGLK